MLDIETTSERDRMIEILDAATWKFFTPDGASGPTCADCLLSPAVTLHEIEPRSKRPMDWWEPENRICLCYRCHLEIHTTGTRANEQRLFDARETYLKMIHRV